jgi:hypothetical protein
VVSGRAVRRQVTENRRPRVPVRCGECDTFHQQLSCPCCGEIPAEAWVSVLYTEVTTEAGNRLAVSAERVEDGGWSPIGVERLGDGEDTTVWGTR